MTKQTKITIDEMIELDKKQDGECLSETYITAITRLTWKCSKGHIFEATPTKVKKGRWCFKCRNKEAASKRRTTIQEIQEIAKLHQGKCLSIEYNPKENLEWQCQLGHTWFANFLNVKRGSWCPFCGHKKGGRKHLTIEEMIELAKSRGENVYQKVMKMITQK
jgi:hypothetical protein